MLKKIKNKMFVEMNPWFRNHVIIPKNKARSKGITDVTLLCNNCLGGVIFHELGMKFFSPTINLWMYPSDFIKYCSNIHHYSNCQLKFVDFHKYFPYDNSEECPVALLDDIIVFFQHYKTEKEAREKWIERTKRINYDNIRCLLSERDGCTYEDLKAFSKLPYPKAALVHQPVWELPNCHYIKGFEQSGGVGNLMEFKKNQYFGFKYFDDFDFVKFLKK